jgi:DNA-binding NtrC family response regulator
MTLKEMERQHIIRVLKETDGNKTHAASLLDIARGTLYEKLKYYRIKQSLYNKGSCDE